MATGLGAVLVTLLVAGVVIEGGGAGIAVELDTCDWLLAEVAVVADKDTDVDDTGGGGCDSFKCLPRTMSDTVGRVPLLSSPLEGM